MILAPLKEAPPNVRRLVVVADGALHYVPFAALPLPAEAKTPPQTLNARYEVVNLPSVSALAALRKQLQGRPPAERLLAVFADPVFDDKDPRVYAAVAAKTGGGPGRIEKAQLANALHGAGFRGDALGRLLDSRREAEAIIQLAKGRGAVVKKLDFDANRDQLLNGELGQYRILHFATHGLLNTQQPELSGLAFSLVDAGGQPRNGFVRLHDIYNLDLNADLVVLSACQTGLGQEVKGEGLIGLTRGFMYAGARRVVASLWQVDDEATAEFMRHFYAAMLQNNDTPAAALRRAQWQMQRSRRWRAPYYWAAFTLQGEWR
jgi:CHAT domain-containing protein